MRTHQAQSREKQDRAGSRAGHRHQTKTGPFWFNKPMPRPRFFYLYHPLPSKNRSRTNSADPVCCFACPRFAYPENRPDTIFCTISHNFKFPDNITFTEEYLQSLHFTQAQPSEIQNHPAQLLKLQCHPLPLLVILLFPQSSSFLAIHLPVTA